MNNEGVLLTGNANMLLAFLVSDHSNLSEVVNKVLTQEMQKIFISKDLESFNEEFLKRNPTSIQHQLSGWFVVVTLEERELCPV